MKPVEAVAVDGTAEAVGRFDAGYIQITVVPIGGSNSGTGTITCRPDASSAVGAGYEAAFDAAGAVPELDMIAQKTLTVVGQFSGVKVE